MGKLFALLVGINDYPEGTRSLQGCLNDIDNARDYLTENFDQPAIEILTNGDATYANVIAAFKTHLGRAGKDDVAMLHYSGHGARSRAASEFHIFDRDKRDQGLVCVDSRLGDNYDLADKELAVLISELAKNDPHIAMIFDCCHSGSGTRDLEDASVAGVRGTGEGNFPRRIETYANGYYARMAQSGALHIPQSQHILMAACDRDETAKESLESHRGIFSTSLYDVLRQSGGAISYAELHVRVRARVHHYIREQGDSSQRPQFEPVAGFDGWSGFLGHASRAGGRTFAGGASRLNRKPIMVAKIGEKWVADAGAVSGIAVSPASPVSLSLALESQPDTAAGSAHVVRVGGSRSDIKPDFEADPTQRYIAMVTSMPTVPLRIAFSGDRAEREALDRLLADDPAMRAMVVDTGEPDDGYLASVKTGALELSRRDDNRVLLSMAWDASGGQGEKLLSALGHIDQWHQLLALNNPAPQLDPALVDFGFATRLSGGDEILLSGPVVTLDVGRRSDGKWEGRQGALRVRNRTGSRLNFALLHFGSDYSVRVIANDQVAPSDEYMTVSIDKGNGTADPMVGFWLDQDREAVEQFKLVLATEPIDAFLLEMEALTRDRAFGSAEEMADALKTIDDDWFVRDLRVRIAPRLATVGAMAATLAGGQVVVEPHSAVTANIALVKPLGPARGIGQDDDFAAMLAPNGIMPCGFAGERGEAVQALDITGISNPDALGDNPLMLKLALPLKDGEVLMPMVRDGAHLMPAGDFWRNDDGSTQLAIRHIPAPLVDHRSIGGSLRMWFFKAVVGMDRVNRLRLVTFDAHGNAEYQSGDAVRKAVSESQRPLLAIHGIIGDTAGMLAGVHQMELAARFDCVLAYDYENLSTPIDQTARQLAADLADAGFASGDGKKLTLLAHSMGGLVSRWFIEKEGGADRVHHLVMCGTPNAGSPFGEIGKARTILQALLTIGANFALPVCASAAAVLSASSKLTPTLEQMAPDSDFIKALNTAAAPQTRYTILAGDIAQYKAPDQRFFDMLLAKIGRSAPLDTVFSGSENDIAVKLHSILLEHDAVERKAARQTVGCHHLNYFSSPAGQKALRAVDWN